MPTEGELAVLVKQMDDASVQLHAAMLHFDLTAGQLRDAVERIRLERYENAVVFDGLRLLAAEVTPDSRHHSLHEVAS